MIASHTPVIGIGIRGVIINSPKSANRDDPFGGKDYLYVPKVDGAFSAIAELAAIYPVIVIAKAGAVVQRKVNGWFEDQKFFAATGLHPSKIFYATSREEKATIAREHGVTHSIDNRLETLKFMGRDVLNLFAFNVDLHQRAKYLDVSRKVTYVDSWEELKGILLP